MASPPCLRSNFVPALFFIVRRRFAPMMAMGPARAAVERPLAGKSAASAGTMSLAAELMVFSARVRSGLPLFLSSRFR